MQHAIVDRGSIIASHHKYEYIHLECTSLFNLLDTTNMDSLDDVFNTTEMYDIGMEILHADQEAYCSLADRVADLKNYNGVLERNLKTQRTLTLGYLEDLENLRTEKRKVEFAYQQALKRIEELNASMEHLQTKYDNIEHQLQEEIQFGVELKTSLESFFFEESTLAIFE